ncbi:MAG: Asp-tRNA(Asn)/Glu-tRNA(Gln) amidotransferase subunit GatC [Phycisphaerae bacterium]
MSSSAIVDEALVRHVAKLARLSLSDDEVRRFARQLAVIVDYISQLKDAETTGIEPLAHPLALCDVLRDDRPAESLDVETALVNAPQRERTFFRVPAVLDDAGGA